MKRIAHFVVVTVLAFSAQAAWSDEAVEQAATGSSTERLEAYLSVAAIDSVAERKTYSSGAFMSRRPEGLVETLGLAGHDGFPSRGGPIDN